jgi:signal transduction histidine kinase
MLILGTDGRFEGLASKRPVIIETLQTHAGLALNSLLLRRQIQQLTAETIGFAAGALGHTLAASVAHELKNGLQRVNGQVEDIIEKASFSDALAGRGLISKLNAEIARLSSLVNGMFQVSNGLQGFKGIVAQKKWFYLNEIVRDAVQLANVVAATKYDKKGIEVETTLAKELDQPSGISDERLARFNSEFSASAEEPIPHKLPSHPIFADPNQIRQVIINLLINAIEAYQYSGRRQLIHIKTESMKSGLPHHATESVRVEVTDYGCGFTAECRTHLFEIGYTTTGGAGLGLYVVKTLVEDQHGGTLYASSPGVGAGATFGFIIPRHGSNMDYVD